MKNESVYNQINVISWLFLATILLYSVIYYPNQHPIPCSFKFFTGSTCASCGFSSAFSYFCNAEFDAGITINSKSFLVFLFLVYQFILRTILLLAHFTTRKKVSRQYIKFDVLISISFFLCAFLPLVFKN